MNERKLPRKHTCRTPDRDRQTRFPGPAPLRSVHAGFPRADLPFVLILHTTRTSHPTGSTETFFRSDPIFSFQKFLDFAPRIHRMYSSVTQGTQFLQRSYGRIHNDGSTLDPRITVGSVFVLLFPGRLQSLHISAPTARLCFRPGSLSVLLTSPG